MKAEKYMIKREKTLGLFIIRGNSAIYLKAESPPANKY